ncbi:hypothetical protein EKK58_03085 [Candidatus Dependentiae bacterium]|nr:MAG: hypothetical protein EKK58_03085 [Candidatus Dependentiae bacterium]
MLKYNKLLFFVFLMGCIANAHSMHNSHVLITGAIVNTYELADAYYNQIQDVDLNKDLGMVQPDDYSTEKESITEEEIDQIGMQSNNKECITLEDKSNVNISTIHGILETQYFEWFQKNVQPQISNDRIKREQWVVRQAIRKFKESNNIQRTHTKKHDAENINLNITGKEWNFIKRLLDTYPEVGISYIYKKYLIIKI